MGAAIVRAGDGLPAEELPACLVAFHFAPAFGDFEVVDGLVVVHLTIRRVDVRVDVHLLVLLWLGRVILDLARSADLLREFRGENLIEHHGLLNETVTAPSGDELIETP